MNFRNHDLNCGKVGLLGTISLGLSCLLCAVAAVNLGLILRHEIQNRAIVTASRLNHVIDGALTLCGISLAAKEAEHDKKGVEAAHPALVLVFSSESARSLQSVDAWIRLIRRLPPQESIWLVSVDEFSTAESVIGLLEESGRPSRLYKIVDPQEFASLTGITRIPAVLVFNPSLDVTFVSEGVLSPDNAERMIASREGEGTLVPSAEMIHGDDDGLMERRVTQK